MRPVLSKDHDSMAPERYDAPVIESFAVEVEAMLCISGANLEFGQEFSEFI